MKSKNKVYVIFIITIIAMVLVFLCMVCVIFSEREIRVTKRELRKKYGEEFIVHNVYPKKSGAYFANCSPVSNEEIVFRAAVWKGDRGLEYDEYPRGIWEGETQKEIEEEMEKYHDNIFVRVYLPYDAEEHLRDGSTNVRDMTIEEYIKGTDPLWCRIEIGIDAEEGNGHLEEEYAFYEGMRERIAEKKLPSLRVVYYKMDAELREWCNNYFAQQAEARGAYLSKRAKCDKIEFECTADGVSVTYDEFKIMREELGKDE